MRIHGDGAFYGRDKFDESGFRRHAYLHARVYIYIHTDIVYMHTFCVLSVREASVWRPMHDSSERLSILFDTLLKLSLRAAKLNRDIGISFSRSARVYSPVDNTTPASG